MRLTVSFIVLLFVATAAAGLLWGNIPEARAGETAARLVASVAMPVALLSFLLLARIVWKIDVARRAGKGDL